MRINIPIIAFSLSVLFLTISSCKKTKDEPTPEPVPVQPNLELKITFNIDGQSLMYDTILYQNLAGNNYSVSTLLFYLSRISFVKSDSSMVAVKDYIYVDASDPVTTSVRISGVPEGCYTGLKFNLGLDSIQNVTGGLPNTVENLSMEWPVPMGGGYHFMKMEGYFMDTTATPGYAMHMGRNNSKIAYQFSKSFCITSSMQTLTLKMNINEWYRVPYTYDFITSGNATMYNDSLMALIVQNGADVFSIE